jgi:hypothetical protein
VLLLNFAVAGHCAQKETDMKKLFFTALIVAAFGSSAHAKPNHVLHGLFCNTEAQVDETLAHMALTLTPQAAVELTNEKLIACVLADKIRYMITRPFIIGQKKGDVLLIKYQATLVGVLVGDNIRPVEPPVQIYFVTPERLNGAEELGGA